MCNGDLNPLSSPWPPCAAMVAWSYTVRWISVFPCHLPCQSPLGWDLRTLLQGTGLAVPPSVLAQCSPELQLEEGCTETPQVAQPQRHSGSKSAFPSFQALSEQEPTRNKGHTPKSAFRTHKKRLSEYFFQSHRRPHRGAS